jgi:hypothetical protein
VADLVANLQHLDPESAVLLYDGSGGALLGELSGLTGPGVLIHPRPRAMAFGTPLAMSQAFHGRPISAVAAVC